MRQCPDCEEKDRVVIAGKVFCANCGTPWQPTDATEEAAYKQKIGMDAPSAGATAPTPAPPASSVPPVSPPAPAPTPPQVTPTPAPASPPAVAPAPASAPASQPQAVTQASAVAPPTPPQVTPTPAPAAAPSPVVPVVVPSADKPLADLQSQIGSEIPNLDAKEESVLSDSQMKEMASVPVAPPQPAPVVETTPAVAPVTAPAQQPAAQVSAPPTSTTPTPASQQASKVLNDIVAPTPSVTPAPSQPTPAGSTTTVAGVTMSREDALKLALGEDAAPQAATKTGPARPTAVVMTVIGLALLGAFLWQVNATDIQVKLASLRAGLTASVPGFVPGGWSKAQSLKASEGGVSYELVKDGKSLKVEQQKSDWDSQAVLEQYVLRRSTDYLALQSQGLTIYMYGDNQAAWVNQGTFYTLSGDHGIEQDDIIRMATSL